MINRNDLRLGNLVGTGGGFVRILGIPDGGPYQVEPFPHRFESREHILELEGIVLSGEILERCGFSKQMPGYPIYTKGDVTLKGIGPTYHLFHEHAIIGIGVRYLHQLQNLYYAITSQELEYKA